jgi:hypothetical protein
MLKKQRSFTQLIIVLTSLFIYQPVALANLAIEKLPGDEFNLPIEVTQNVEKIFSTDSNFISVIVSIPSDTEIEPENTKIERKAHKSIECVFFKFIDNIKIRTCESSSTFYSENHFEVKNYQIYLENNQTIPKQALDKSLKQFNRVGGYPAMVIFISLPEATDVSCIAFKLPNDHLVKKCTPEFDNLVEETVLEIDYFFFTPEAVEPTLLSTEGDLYVKEGH